MNIIYFNPDQMRADMLGCYGHPLAQTPNIDRLASEGVRFDQCHVQHTVCTPSRCCFTTGWYPHVRGHRTLWHPLQPDEPNTLKYLKQAGYQVDWIGKNDLLSPGAFADSVTRVHDWGEGANGDRGIFRPDEPGYWSFLYGPMPDHNADWHVITRAIEFLQSRRPDDPPFMLYLPILFPHCPFTCPQPWYDMYNPDDLPPMRPSDLPNKPIFHRLIRQYRHLDALDDAVFRKLRAVYLGMISYVDAMLGRLLQALEETGLDADTSLFFFSDHGEWAGDYGLVEKWQSGLDDCLTRVPMIVKTPGCAGGHVVREPIESFDIVPTTLELAGVECRHTHFAHSMLPQLGGAAGDPERAVFAEGGYAPHEPHCYEGTPGGFGDITDDRSGIYYPKGRQQQEHPESSVRCTMLRTATHKLVYRPGDVSELYDLTADPMELHNLYNQPAYAEVQQQLERRLLAWYQHTSDVVPFERDPRGFPREILS
ncbi:MAG: sulfatase-like hydrolase/transferase [Armatimonadota bacterium]